MASLEERLRELVAIGNSLSADVDLDALLERVVAAAAQLTGARYAALGVLDESGQGLQAFHTHGLDRAAVLAAVGRLPEGHGLLGALIEDPRPLRLARLAEDPRSIGLPPGHPPMESFLGVPILVRGHVYGNLYLTDKPAGFSSEDEELVTLLANRAGVGIALRQQVARDSLRRILEAQEIERRRLARELHDETGQALTSILLGLKAVEAAPDLVSARAAGEQLRELVVETLRGVRELAVELRPKALDDFGLVPALERLIDDVRERSGLRVELSAQLDGRLSAEAETALYRITQEALANVLKHAQASQVSVLLTAEARGVSLIVEDDGQGFSGPRRPDALGLSGVEERAALLGGQATVESGPQGTVLSVELPLASA